MGNRKQGEPVRALAAAIVAVALIGADLAGDLWLDNPASDAWALANTFWLLFTAWVIWHDPNRKATRQEE